MNEARPARDDQPIGLAQIAADDLLLDAVGGDLDAVGRDLDAVGRDLDAVGRDGAPPGADDPAGVLLRAWRADIETGIEPAAQPAAAAAAGATAAQPAASAAAGATAAQPAASAAAGATAQPAAESAATEIRRRRPGKLRTALVAAAATTAVVSGLGLAAHQAGPNSPLWPITRVVYPQRADVAAAEVAVDEARSAVASGRYDRARQLLATAVERAAQIDDATAAGRVRAEIEAVRRELAAVAPIATSPAPATSERVQAPADAPRSPAASTTPAPAPGAGRQPAGSTTDRTPTPTPTPGPDNPLPGLPLLPSLKLPSLPPILPTTLPLIGGES